MSCNPTGIGRMSATIPMAGRPQSGEDDPGGEGDGPQGRLRAQADCRHHCCRRQRVQIPAQGAGRVQHHRHGRRRHHRRRHLRAHRHGGRALCGARAHHLLRACSDRLWPGRPVLCRAFDSAAGAGLDLHLHLRDVGRACRLDDRLGPDPGIFHGRKRRRLRLVGLFQQPAGADGHGAAAQASVGDRRADRAGRRIARHGHRPRAGPP
jgi:hypothetical protein